MFGNIKGGMAAAIVAVGRQVCSLQAQAMLPRL